MTMSQDTPRRTRLAEARQARMDRPEVAAEYEQTRLRYELGEAVRPAPAGRAGRDEPARRCPLRGWRYHPYVAAAGTAGPGARPDPQRQPRPATAPLGLTIKWRCDVGHNLSGLADSSGQQRPPAAFCGQYPAAIDGQAAFAPGRYWPHSGRQTPRIRCRECGKRPGHGQYH